MTKVDIVERIFQESQFTKAQCYDLAEAVFSLIKDTLEEGETLKISGFGSFVPKEKNARRGRNPRTGEELILSPRRVLIFKASRILKEAINTACVEGPMVTA